MALGQLPTGWSMEAIPRMGICSIPSKLQQSACLCPHLPVSSVLLIARDEVPKPSHQYCARDLADCFDLEPPRSLVAFLELLRVSPPLPLTAPAACRRCLSNL
eukprot:SM000253S09051  [mRNA]  locus=s253:181185:181784:- [translate_table: standard]